MLSLSCAQYTKKNALTVNGYSREIRAVGRSAARQSLSQGFGKRALTDESGCVPGRGEPGPHRAAATRCRRRADCHSCVRLVCECRGRVTSSPDKGTGGARSDSNRWKNRVGGRGALAGAGDALT